MLNLQDQLTVRGANTSVRTHGYEAHEKLHTVLIGNYDRNREGSPEPFRRSRPIAKDCTPLVSLDTVIYIFKLA
jgi:hypothetical protein